MHHIAFRSSVAAVAGLAAVLSLAACAPPAEEEVDRTLVLAVDGFASTQWDPSQGGAGMGYDGQALFDVLVRFGGDGAPLPGIGLAEEYELSEDRMSVDLTLREGVTFADGSQLDAPGVAAWFNHVIASDLYLFGGNARSSGLAFESTGDRTLTITASKPLFHPSNYVNDLLRLVLGSTAVLSPAAIDDPALASAEPLGSGPYVIDDLEPDVELTLVRNPDYWNPDAYPYDTIVLKSLPDPIAKLNALKSGQVDAAALSPDQVAEAESSGLKIFTSSTRYFSLMIRDPDASTLEPLRDVRVRQAMSLAFDRDSIAETLDLGYGRASSQAFVEGQAEYIEGGDDRYPYDLDRARELMADAGYADGFDLEIPTFEENTAVQPIVSQSLADIGIRVSYREFADGGAWLAAALGGDYPVSLYRSHNVNTLRLLDDPIGDFGTFFAPNAKLEALLSTIRTGDPDESAAASQELGEKILDEVWHIPFSRPADFWGADGEKVRVLMNDSREPWLVFFQLPD